MVGVKRPFVAGQVPGEVFRMVRGCLRLGNQNPNNISDSLWQFIGAFMVWFDTEYYDMTLDEVINFNEGLEGVLCT